MTKKYLDMTKASELYTTFNNLCHEIDHEANSYAEVKGLNDRARKFLAGFNREIHDNWDKWVIEDKGKTK